MAFGNRLRGGITGASPEEIAHNASERTIRPLAKWYRMPNIEEICINRYGEVWIKRSAHEWTHHEDPNITPYSIELALSNLANRTGQHFDIRSNPILYADTKPDAARLSSILGGNCRYTPNDEAGVAIAIRPPTSVVRDFHAWGLTSNTTFQEMIGTRHTRNQQFYSTTSVLADLKEAIGREGSICVSGAMSTGKTQFLKRVLHEVPMSKRVVELADVAELEIPQPNHITLVTSRTGTGSNAVDWKVLLDFVKRATPDLPICQEVSARNGDVVYQLLNMGLPFLCTVHANSAMEAITAIYQNVANCNPGLSYEVVTAIITSAFARIVQLEKTGTGTGRNVVEYVIPAEIVGRKTFRGFKDEFEQFRSQKPEIRTAILEERMGS